MTVPDIIITGIASLSAALNIALSVVVVRQRSWKQTIDNQKASIDAQADSLNAALAELSVHERARERLSLENRGLIKENERLKALTDLEPLSKLLVQHSKTLQDWIAEGRTRFEAATRRLDEIHIQQATGLTAILEEMKAQRIVSERTMTNIADSIKEQGLQLAAHILDDKQTALRTVAILDSLERRMSDTAVRIGVTEWSSKLDS